MKMVFCGLFGTATLCFGIFAFHSYSSTPTPVLSPARVAQIEQSIASNLKTSLLYTRRSRDWVTVKNCQITLRRHAPAACPANAAPGYSETRIDLNEIAHVDYFEPPQSRSGFKSSLTLDYRDDVKGYLTTARQQMWQFLGQGRGMNEAFWAPHVATAEQKIIKSMELDQISSYAVTAECGGTVRVRHLPETRETLLLNSRSRATAQSLKLYHHYCATLKDAV